MLIPNANHLYKISLALKKEFKESDLSNMFIIFELDEGDDEAEDQNEDVKPSTPLLVPYSWKNERKSKDG